MILHAAPRLFDRIEIGTVRRQEHQAGAEGFDNLPTLGVQCTERLSATNHVARSQSRAMFLVLLEPALKGARTDPKDGGDLQLGVIAGLIGGKRPLANL